MIRTVCALASFLPSPCWHRRTFASTRTATTCRSSSSSARFLSSSSSVVPYDSRESNPNRLGGVTSLNNDYFALRHAQSKANVANIIISDLETGSLEYGLSEPDGLHQAADAAINVTDQYLNKTEAIRKFEGLAVISSEFLRAMETADLVRTCAIANDIPVYNETNLILDPRLRERSFGEYENTSDSNYQVVWKLDEVDSSQTGKSVESVDSVMRRATECVLEIEETLENYMVVLVSHGDVLQILQTAFKKLPGTEHRRVRPLETATLRALELNPVELFRDNRYDDDSDDSDDDDNDASSEDEENEGTSK